MKLFYLLKFSHNKKIKRLRADSASYQAKIFNYCDANDILYTIGGQLDSATLKLVKKLDKSDFKQLPNQDRQSAAEVIHTMNHTDNAFRLIVVKKDTTPKFSELEDTLTQEEKEAYYSERYSVIATNDNDSSLEEIIHFYRQRGETSENKIKELKCGFNLDYLPTSDFISNALYFQIGTLAYNLFMIFKQILDTNLQKHTVKSIRYKLYNIAGKVITHSRKLILKVSNEYLPLFQRIRDRAYKASLQ